MSRTWKKPALAQREPRPDPKGGHINLVREGIEELVDDFDEDLLEALGEEDDE